MGVDEVLTIHCIVCADGDIELVSDNLIEEAQAGRRLHKVLPTWETPPVLLP